MKIENPNSSGLFDFLEEKPKKELCPVPEDLFDFEETGEEKKKTDFKAEHPYLEYGEPKCDNVEEVGEDMESKWFE